MHLKTVSKNVKCVQFVIKEVKIVKLVYGPLILTGTMFKIIFGYCDIWILKMEYSSIDTTTIMKVKDLSTSSWLCDCAYVQTPELALTLFWASNISVL